MKFAKYIIVKKHGLECAILIQPPLNHNECLHTGKLSDDCQIISAGYFSIVDGQVLVVPDMPSTTLGLKPRPHDSAAITQSLFLMGLLPASAISRHASEPNKEGALNSSDRELSAGAGSTTPAPAFISNL